MWGRGCTRSVVFGRLAQETPNTSCCHRRCYVLEEGTFTVPAVGTSNPWAAWGASSWLFNHPMHLLIVERKCKLNHVESKRIRNPAGCVPGAPDTTFPASHGKNLKRAGIFAGAASESRGIAFLALFDLDPA